jgi:hypothetical protein
MKEEETVAVNHNKSVAANPLSLGDWDKIAQRRGPKLLHWILAAVTVACIMLYMSPMKHSSSLFGSSVAVLLSPLVLLLGWLTGITTFSLSYEPFRRLHRTWPLGFLIPLLLAATTALGILGGRYWWLLTSCLAFLGHRKGTQRAYWSAVTGLAFSFRRSQMGLHPLADTDDDALAKAIEAVKRAIMRK